MEEGKANAHLRRMFVVELDGDGALPISVLMNDWNSLW